MYLEVQLSVKKKWGMGGTRNISLDTYCIYRLMEPIVYFLGGVSNTIRVPTPLIWGGLATTQSTFPIAFP